MRKAKCKTMAGGALLYEGLAPMEETEQAWLFSWAGLQAGKYPELDAMYHIPNGGARRKSEAARLKAAGVKPGTPDIHLPAGHTGADGRQYLSLYIELKRLEKGRVSDAQHRRIQALRRLGNACEVCYGWLEAKAVIEDYLNGRYFPKWKVPQEE